MKILDAFVHGFIGLIIGMILMSQIYGERVNQFEENLFKSKEALHESITQSDRCMTLLRDMEDLADRQNNLIMNLPN